MKQRYVRLVRPVFQSACIEVEGEDESEARGGALASASGIPEQEWRGRFNPDDYFVDAHCVRSGTTADGAPFSLLDFPQYLLLNTGESPFGCSSTTQPWMAYLSPITVAALYSSWINGLINERAVHYEDALEGFEEMLRSWKGTDQKVVPLMPPAERRHDIALVEALVEGISVLKQTE